MVIAQNGPALQKTANELDDITRDFVSLYEQLYSELDRCLGTPEETSKIWYGPRAVGCKNAANKGKPQFIEMKTNLNQLRDTINNQASAWAQQQNKKY